MWEILAFGKLHNVNGSVKPSKWVQADLHTMIARSYISLLE